MDYRKRGSHAQGVHPTQYTQRMETVRMKQEEEADIRIMQKSSKTSRRKEPMGTKGKSPKKDLTSAKDQKLSSPP